jgi:predicted DNA-binding antitoxin AbrB/MazE fold protein
MSMTIDAVYEGGSFRPARPLPLTEHQRVRLTVEAMPMESALPEDPILAQLTALTQRLFGGDVKALRKSDPEIPGEQFVAFTRPRLALVRRLRPRKTRGIRTSWESFRSDLVNSGWSSWCDECH